MHIEPGAQRFMIWLSMAMIVVFGIAYGAFTGFWPPPAASLGAEEVASLYTDHNLKLRIGVVLCLITGAYNLPWTVVVGAQMARHENGAPIWAILQVLSGTLGVILLTLPALFWGVAAFSPERDPQVTLLMHELAFLCFVTPVTFFVLQALPIAIIGLRQKDDSTSAFPRWIGFFSAFMLVSAEVGVMAQLFKRGPFSWNGVFTFWVPLSVFVAWFFSLAFTMLRAISRQQLAASAQAS